MLRHGVACGQAFAAHGREGAAILRRAHGGLPPTLHPDEETVFAQAFGAAGAQAAALLRSLLAPAPESRPAHALEISRMLCAMRAAMVQAAQPALRRAA
jgi:serine/threonine-protein kinase